ncbi:hypothetical protein [Roseomonas chloroacetimidivorans]|uniref:hypothetical protein n=1 Tax=Roseomonas chloroacetimidivorans TaxID=1766656 RepID=UPI003C729D34
MIAFRDAQANLRRAAERLAARFGPAPIEREYNTLVASWTAGAASIRLIAWPPAWQSDRFTNPVHERDPRVAVACHVTVGTGFRPPLAPAEWAWLGGFEPVAPMRATRA